MGEAVRRRVVPLRALVASLSVLAVTACGSAERAAPAQAPAPSIAATPVDPEVAATGMPEGLDLELIDSTPGSEDGDNVAFVSPVYSVIPVGPLAVAATVTLRLDNAMPETTPLLVATRTSANGPWSYQPGQLTDDQRHVEFSTTSLTEVGVLALDVPGALAGVRDTVRSALYPARGTPPEKPTCEESELAETSGYSVSDTKSKTLHWCLGLRDGSPIVKITNRRTTPVVVDHKDFKVLDGPGKAAAYAPWARVVADTATLLAPGRTVTYSTELETGSKVQLVAASTRETQGLRVLQAGSRAIAALLNDYGVGPARAGTTFTSLLDRKRCARSLTQGVDDVVARCFTDAAMVDLFGSDSVFLSPVLAAPSFEAFLAKQAKVLTSQAAKQGERVVLSRAVPDFAGLVGGWSGSNRQLSVSEAGVVTEKVRDGSSVVIQLTYQLDSPLSKDGVTNAKATITAVKVGNRKQVGGRVPEVGDAGTISLREGVISPPYLKTNYCNAKAAKKGACGAP